MPDQLRAFMDSEEHDVRMLPAGSKTVLSLDDRVVSEALEDGQIQAVVLTDRLGSVIVWRGQQMDDARAGERFDVLLASASETGRTLGLGAVRLGAVMYSGGNLLVASEHSHHLILLAGPEAKLGHLISTARRLCAAVTEA